MHETVQHSESNTVQYSESNTVQYSECSTVRVSQCSTVSALLVWLSYPPCKFHYARMVHGRRHYWLQEAQQQQRVH
jgi:hypothetical protein